MMAHPAKNMPTAVCAAELLGLTSKAHFESQDNSELQSVLWSGEEQPSAKNLDLTHVPEENRERLRRISNKFDKM